VPPLRKILRLAACDSGRQPDFARSHLRDDPGNLACRRAAGQPFLAACGERGRFGSSPIAPACARPHPALAPRRPCDRGDALQVEVPREIYPGVLRQLGDESVDHRHALRLGVDRREVGIGEQVAHDLGVLAGVGQVADVEHARPPAVADRLDRRRDVLEHDELALGLVVVAARPAHAFDRAHAELAGDDRRRHEAAPGDALDRSDGLPGSPLLLSRQASARASLAHAKCGRRRQDRRLLLCAHGSRDRPSRFARHAAPGWYMVCHMGAACRPEVRFSRGSWARASSLAARPRYARRR
jgi:hypothetical protein